MDKQTYKKYLLDILYEPYKNCNQCPLGSLGRTQVVFGDGNPDADLMFIGEGPGRDEDIIGKPFVGRSGKLLEKVILSNNLTRESVFITNIVKCRPPNNRQPLPDEATICKNILLYKQIKIVRPKVICTLGACALKALFDEDIKISLVRGKQMHFEESIVLPTYHPAYILRNSKELPIFYDDIVRAIDLASSGG